MPTLARSKRRILIPQQAKGPPLRGLADVYTDGATVIITADLPAYALVDLRWEVHPGFLVIRSADPNRGLHLVISFDAQVRDGCFVIIARRGIFEVRMERQ